MNEASGMEKVGGPPGAGAGGSRGLPSFTGPALVVAVLVGGFAPAGEPMAAQTPEAEGSRPAVHVISTGGTIANAPGARLSGEELVREVPALDDLARVTAEEFSNLPSGALTLDDWLALAKRIEELWAERPELSGIVVTHGTDTMEETAYFLDLTLAPCRPVVVTGAMRRPTEPGADGPANLLSSVRVAAAQEARELGVVVVMNDQILPAREVTKASTSGADALRAPGAGRLGITDVDGVVLERDRERDGCGEGAFPLSALDELPRVEVVYSTLGADGSQVRAAMEEGAQGIVMAGVGRGGTTPGQQAALEDALDRGVVVVLGSRAEEGRVPVERGAGVDGALLGAGELTPQKARILLMLALTRTQDTGQIREIFARH